MINGLIACDTPHIIKGRIVKVIRTEDVYKRQVPLCADPMYFANLRFQRR